MTESRDRLRNPPGERFGGRARFFDLKEAFDDLPGESVAREGHMQKALYRYGPATTAIFAFEKGAGLDEYRAEAEAMLHVVRGRIRVTTDHDSYELTENQLLLLHPDVPQRLEALEATQLLMTMVTSGVS